MAIRRVANAELAVDDLEAAVEFHRDVLGMIEKGRSDGKVSFGCGLDDAVDVVLTSGRGGVTRFALRVDSGEDLDRYAGRLGEAGVSHARSTDETPGVTETLRFGLPSGHTMELSVVDGPTYVHPSRGTPGRGIRALDFDHITLQAQDAGTLMEFLVDVLDFQVSDIFAPAPGIVGAAWLRSGAWHHDISIISTPEPGKSLHHYALAVESFDHMKMAADHLAQNGFPIEVPPGRHGVGGNINMYFWANGNRYELSGEMPRVEPGEPVTWDSFPAAFSPWGIAPPESFGETS